MHSLLKAAFEKTSRSLIETHLENTICYVLSVQKGIKGQSAGIMTKHCLSVYGHKPQKLSEQAEEHPKTKEKYKN